MNKINSLFIALLSSIALIGCTSTSSNHAQDTMTIKIWCTD